MRKTVVIVDTPQRGKMLTAILRRLDEEIKVKPYSTPSALLAAIRGAVNFPMDCLVTNLYFPYGQGKQASAELSQGHLETWLSREGTAQNETKQLSEKERASTARYLNRLDIALSRERTAQTTLNGIELIKIVRRLPDYIETPIVVWSQYIDVFQKIHVRLAGGAILVSKVEGQKDYRKVEELATLIQSLIQSS
jgi:hypothetical protein